VEFDRDSLDQPVAILWHLATFARLALVVFSDSKSCHERFFWATSQKTNWRVSSIMRTR